MTDQSQISGAKGGLGLRFLAQGELPKLELASDSKEGIQGIRTDLAAEFEPRAKRALSQWPLRTRTEVLGGLSCHIVEPREGDIEREILHFFGGGYVSGKPEYDLPITGALATLCRARVIAPRYALAPEYPYPQAFNQAICLYRARLATENAPPAALSGESAGAGLAAALALAVCRADLAPPSCLALISPWSDLSQAGIDLTRAGNDPTLTTALLRWFAEAYLAGADARAPYVSPGLADTPANWPPTLLTTATGDLLKPMVHAYGNHLRQHAASVEVIEADAPYHVFEAYDECEAARPTLQKTADFILKHASTRGR